MLNFLPETSFCWKPTSAENGPSAYETVRPYMLFSPTLPGTPPKPYIPSTFRPPNWPLYLTELFVVRNGPTGLYTQLSCQKSPTVSGSYVLPIWSKNGVC